MAGTLTKFVVSHNRNGAKLERHMKFTVGAADYDNPGGYPVAAADCELQTLDGINFHGTSPKGYVPTYDPATGKIVVFKDGLTECVDNEAGLNGEIFYATAFGDQANT